jgi:ribosomal protein S12 methylthiotransferase
MSSRKKKQPGAVNFRNSCFRKTCCLITLGCPKNQVDSEFMAGHLEAQGFKLVKNADLADVILINTCGFIEDAKQESIDTILEALRYKEVYPGKEVIVWGCLSERYRGEIEREIPEVDRYFGIEPFEETVRFLSGPDYHSMMNVPLKRILTTPSHVAYLKIAEGCDHQCTFCAIPHFKALPQPDHGQPDS